MIYKLQKINDIFKENFILEKFLISKPEVSSKAIQNPIKKRIHVKIRSKYYKRIKEFDSMPKYDLDKP